MREKLVAPGQEGEKEGYNYFYSSEKGTVCKLQKCRTTSASFAKKKEKKGCSRTSRERRKGKDMLADLGEPGQDPCSFGFTGRTKRFPGGKKPRAAQPDGEKKRKEPGSAGAQRKEKERKPRHLKKEKSEHDRHLVEMKRRGGDLYYVSRGRGEEVLFFGKKKGSRSVDTRWGKRKARFSLKKDRGNGRPHP